MSPFKEARPISILLVPILAASLAMSCATQGPLLVRGAETSAPAPASAAPAASFEEALGAFDFPAAATLAATPEEGRLAEALGLCAKGGFASAREGLFDLARSAGDDKVRRTAGSVLVSFLEQSDEWKEAEEAREELGLEAEPMLAAFASCSPKCRLELPDAGVRLPLLASSWGLCVVKARIEGRERNVVIDTGASISILSSETAAACGIRALQPSAIDAKTATSRKVGIAPAVAGRLELGELAITGLPVGIIDSKDINISAFGFIPLLKIHAIVGWDILRRLDVRIDKAHGYAEFRESRPASGRRNFSWFGFPMVEVETLSGLPLAFGLDTGSNATDLREPFLARTGLSPDKKKKVLTGGAGGWETRSSSLFSSLALRIGGSAFELKDAVVQPERRYLFGATAGTVGIDVAAGRVLRMDFPNGSFTVE